MIKDFDTAYIDYTLQRDYPSAPPDEQSLEGLQLAAGPSATRTDAPQGYGEIRAVQPTRLQSALQTAGVTLEQIGRFVDSIGQVDVPGIGEISLADLMPFVGSAKSGSRSVMGEPEWQGTPKVLQAPAEGKPIVTGKGQTMQLSEDAKLAAFDVLPAAQGLKTAAKGAKKAGAALATKAGEMLESYLTKTGAVLKVAPDAPAIEVSAAPKPSTPAFKKWFANSKVVDDKGQPLVVYHGTDQSFDEFRGNAYFTPMPEDASKYSYVNTPGKEHSPNVVPVYLSLQKPKTIKTYATRADIDDAKAAGFDGVIVQGVGGSKINHYIVFESTQIKSLFNKGTFDPKDPRILHGGGAAATGAATQGEEKK